jgi:hypothetical protein
MPHAIHVAGKLTTTPVTFIYYESSSLLDDLELEWLRH